MVLGLRVNFYKSSISGINLSSDFLEVTSFFYIMEFVIFRSNFLVFLWVIPRGRLRCELML